MLEILCRTFQSTSRVFFVKDSTFASEQTWIHATCLQFASAAAAIEPQVGFGLSQLWIILCQVITTTVHHHVSPKTRRCNQTLQLSSSYNLPAHKIDNDWAESSFWWTKMKNKDGRVRAHISIFHTYSTASPSSSEEEVKKIFDLNSLLKTLYLATV